MARWSIVGAGALLVALVAGTGIWSFVEQREASARHALAAASATYRHTMTTRQEAQLAEAATALQKFLREHPRSAGVAQGAYFLGNVEYERRNLDAARQAYEAAAQRDTGSIAALSRLGLAYVWEAKEDPAQALGAYNQALERRGAKDFLYAELLLGKARMQEQLSKRDEAIQTYRKLLSDVPDSPQADDVRIRLAMLGAGQ